MLCPKTQLGFQPLKDVRQCSCPRRTCNRRRRQKTIEQRKAVAPLRGLFNRDAVGFNSSEACSKGAAMALRLSRDMRRIRSSLPSCALSFVSTHGSGEAYPDLPGDCPSRPVLRNHIPTRELRFKGRIPAQVSEPDVDSVVSSDPLPSWLLTAFPFVRSLASPSTRTDSPYPHRSLRRRPRPDRQHEQLHEQPNHPDGPDYLNCLVLVPGKSRPQYDPRRVEIAESSG
jgi:hypothetical protein